MIKKFKIMLLLAMALSFFPLGNSSDVSAQEQEENLIEENLVEENADEENLELASEVSENGLKKIVEDIASNFRYYSDFSDFVFDSNNNQVIVKSGRKYTNHDYAIILENILLSEKTIFKGLEFTYSSEVVYKLLLDYANSGTLLKDNKAEVTVFDHDKNSYDIELVFVTEDWSKYEKANVANFDQLQKAVDDPRVKEVNFLNDITISDEGDSYPTLYVSRPVKINGNGFTLKTVLDPKKEYYGIGVITTNRISNKPFVLSNITLAGGDYGIRVSSSEVTFEGDIDVTNNKKKWYRNCS